jgi:hypothetical protein
MAAEKPARIIDKKCVHVGPAEPGLEQLRNDFRNHIGIRPARGFRMFL